MPATTIPPHPTLHERVERFTDAGDMRLVYGVGLPFVAMVAFIVAASASGVFWLLAPLMLLVVSMTAIVLVGFAQMLDDEDRRR